MRMLRRLFCSRNIVLAFLLVTLLLYWRSNIGTYEGDRAGMELNHGVKMSRMNSKTKSQLSSLKQAIDLKKLEANGKGAVTNTDSGLHLKMARLLGRLIEIENQIFPGPHSDSVVRVTGSTLSLERNLPFYQPALKKLGYKIRAEPLGNEMDWRALLCFAEEGELSSACIGRSEFSKLKPYQKVSKIPGLQYALTEADAFCYSVTAARDISALEGPTLSPMCFVLPAQFDRFTSYTTTSQVESYWMIKTLDGKQTTNIFLSSKNQAELNRLKTRNVVVQEFSDLLLVSGAPAIVKVYVLVTAMAPLRAYIHHEGAVLLRPFKGDVVDTWSLGQFGEYLVGRYGEDNAAAVFKRIKNVIVHTLLITEPSVAPHFNGLTVTNQLYRCQHCFQLLEFDCVIRNSSLTPLVVQVSGEPNLQQLEKVIRSSGSSQTTSAVGQDTVNLMFNRFSVAKMVFNVLNQAKKSAKRVEILHCKALDELCVREVDLEYLIAAKREASNLQGFSKLYPVADGAKYSELLNDLRSSEVGRLPGAEFGKTGSLGTPQLHEMLTAIERLYLSGGSDVGIISSNLWEVSDSEIETRKSKSAVSGVSGSPVLQSTGGDIHKCDPDPNGEPILAALHVEPEGEMMRPPFDKDAVKIYHVEVPFKTMVVRIWGRAALCRYQVRLDTNVDATRPLNYSVGVGWNKLVLQIVDTNHSPTWIMNTYTVYIYRKTRFEETKTFDNSQPHQVCGLLQECELRVEPNKPCGLQKLQDDSWKSFLRLRTELNVCRTGNDHGQWAVPCERCLNPDSCYWQKAFWAPHFCRHKLLTRVHVQKCLANKKILFIGDSTNRGIMYYLIEKVNGTLTKWDKTHEIRIFDDELNGGRTSVSFSYYPQFWLPTNKKPDFRKALYQLIARFLPLENNTNTVLVVGGLQWMVSQHIVLIRNVLDRLGLNGIKVVVKSLGAGFHLAVPGLTRLPQREHQRVAVKNGLLIEAARRAGYEVIDTYNITIPRYRDFVEGKCGCHFHKVVDLQTLAREKGEAPSLLLEQRNHIPFHEQDSPPRYHVIGPINAFYSEILITRICS